MTTLTVIRGGLSRPPYAIDLCNLWQRQEAARFIRDARYLFPGMSRAGILRNAAMDARNTARARSHSKAHVAFYAFISEALQSAV